MTRVEETSCEVHTFTVIRFLLFLTINGIEVAEIFFQIFIFILFESQTEPFHPLVHPTQECPQQPGVWNSIRVSQVDSKNPRTRVVICHLPGAQWQEAGLEVEAPVWGLLSQAGTRLLCQMPAPGRRVSHRLLLTSDTVQQSQNSNIPRFLGMLYNQ